jgi:tetratricopeptide (TPR) repeat protein
VWSGCATNPVQDAAPPGVAGNLSDDIALARESALRAEASADEDVQRQAAQRGIAAAERALAIAPERVEPHYYLAVNLGLLARVEPMRALSLVKRLEGEAKLAAAIDERFEHAGPLRALGSVYARAPGWPVSVGDPDRAVQLLERAVAMAPDFAINHLMLGEAYFAAERLTDAEREIRQALPNLPSHWHAEANAYLGKIRARE